MSNLLKACTAVLAATAAVLLSLLLAATPAHAGHGGSHPLLEIRPLSQSNAHVKGGGASDQALTPGTAKTVHINEGIDRIYPSKPLNTDPNNWEGTNWNPFINRVNFYRSKGFNVRSVRVMGAPRWMTDCPAGYGTRCLPSNTAENNAYLRKFATQLEWVNAWWGLGVGRFSWWNEPNSPGNVGGLTEGGGGPFEYARTLRLFHIGVKNANSNRGVDCAEVGASRGAGSSTGSWFNTWWSIMDNQGWKRHCDFINIHPFVDRPVDVANKINAHKAVTKKRVHPTAWGWARGVAHGQTEKPWVCVGNATAQRDNFVRAINHVRDRTSGVLWMVYFSGVDNWTPNDKLAECRWSYYIDDPVTCPTANNPPPWRRPFRNVNSFGLYFRTNDGDRCNSKRLFERPLAVAFRNQPQ